MKDDGGGTKIRCPKCHGVLEVQTLVPAGPQGRTKRATCEPCLVTYTIAEILVCEVVKHGQGAHGLARKLVDGKAQIVVQETTPASRGRPSSRS